MPAHNLLLLQADRVSALMLLGLLLGCALAGGIGAARRRWDLLAGAAMVGVTFQAIHMTEHISQFGYWLTHPSQPPWMSPVGASAHSGFSALGLSPLVATEAMHLVGNAIFLVSLSCLWRQACWRCEAVGPEAVRLLRGAWIVEALHMTEHVALTLSAGLTGRAAGVSTAFGLVGPGPGLWSYRVVWHFVANLIPVVLVVAALCRRQVAVRLLTLS